MAESRRPGDQFYAVGSEAYAYPIKILNLHEIVNDVIDGKPVLISYCPLCASAIVYKRQLLDSRELVFGNTSALYANDLVMFGPQTGSYWYQVAGKSIVGELSGSRLDLLSSVTVQWGTWRVIHPDTQVLA